MRFIGCYYRNDLFGSGEIPTPGARALSCDGELYFEVWDGAGFFNAIKNENNGVIAAFSPENILQALLRQFGRE